MKILLINPPRSPYNAIYDHAPPEAKPFVHQKLVGPPLGLLTVAGSLRDHDVTLLELKALYDLHPSAPPPSTIVSNTINHTKPHIVGISVITSEVPASLDILKTVKALAPDTITVVGGLHAALAPQDLCDPSVDIVCPSTEARVFREIVNAVQTCQPYDKVHGILVQQENKLIPVSLSTRQTVSISDDFIMPNRDLVKPWLSAYVVGKANGPSTYLNTSLGCPYRCSFCSIWPQYKGLYRKRSVECVIRELKTLNDYPVVRLADANTLGDPDYICSLCKRIEEEEIKKFYVADIRADTVVEQPGLIKRFAKAGLGVAVVGFESHKQCEIDHYEKKMSVNKIADAVTIMHDHGILVRGNYMVPPNYTRADFDDLAAFADRHRIALPGFTILTPMPGTRFYNETYDSIIDHDLSKYNLFNCVIKPKLDIDEFCERVGALWKIRLGNLTI